MPPVLCPDDSGRPDGLDTDDDSADSDGLDADTIDDSFDSDDCSLNIDS